MKTRMVLLPALLGVLSCLLAGCGGAGKGHQEVFGAVTFKGEPIADGTIQFFALTEQRLLSGGAMIRNGEYHLPAEHGLPAGKYLVRISSLERLPSGAAGQQDIMSTPMLSRERIPSRFNTQSSLTIEVRGGESGEFDFVLE